MQKSTSSSRSSGAPWTLRRRRPNAARRRFIGLVVLIVCAVAAPSPRADAGDEQLWQLVVAYGQEGLRVESAAPIPPLTKRVTRPGLTGAVGRVGYRVEWLDPEGGLLAETVAELPLGQRAAIQPDGACLLSIPGEDVIVLRLAGPPAASLPASIRLTRLSVSRLGEAFELPPAFMATSVSLTIPPTPEPALRDGPISVTKIRDTGPDDNRIVVVVLGDGYTAADLLAGSFEDDANDFVQAFDGYAPWDEYGEMLNVYRLDVESNESGADGDPTQGTLRDTYLNSAFWTNGIERLLAINSTGRSRAIAAANSLVGVGVWDHLFVTVNSTKYGGSGGSISVASVHPSANLVILHEFGHTFAGLADEYESAYPGFPPGDGEPNVDYDASGAGLKWLDWVEEGTPLPTPENSSFGDVVGTFEGARYLTTGIYRPWFNCGMRNLGPDFCPVCQEAHIKEVHDVVSVLDGASPPVGSTLDVGEAGTTITLDAIAIASLEFEWRLDGVPIVDETTTTLLLTPDMMSSDTQTLSVVVSETNSRLRLHTISESFSWTVVDASSTSPSGFSVR